MFENFTNFVLAAGTIEVGNYAIDLGISTWWWPYLYETIKFILILLTIIYAVGIVLVFSRIQGSFKIKIKEIMEEAMEAGKLPKTKIQKDWDKISSDVESDNLQDNKNAVIAAEELFDDILKATKFSGENIEQRLSKVSDEQFHIKDDVIWAHNLKKRIESDESLEIEKEEARRAVDIFERALREFNIL